MATAKDFVGRINQIDGVAGCLLIKNDGVLFGQTVDDAEVYSALLQISNSLSADIMEKIGFSYCRHISFSRTNNQNFYVFPIDNYLLGIVQKSDCSVAPMLETVYRFINRVATGRSTT
ncbi:MAG: roadblock/LC7 domain-containing protein [Desulfuromusa sp.]|nr:roadblock/LC7 domain-containing protein [Desulfuromusa sp.]